MVKGLLHVLGGYRSVRVSGEYAASVLNILCSREYTHWGMHSDTDGGIIFCIAVSGSDTLQETCEKHSIPIGMGKTRGFPALWHRYRQRWGILIGALIFSVLTYLSCRVVWAIEVTGNEKLEDRQIVQMLSDYGFGVGSAFGRVDFDVLQNEFLLTTDEIAWISVNMVGTVAHVQVRENLGGSRGGGGTDGIANMIAAEDGQIVEVQIRSGKPAVVINDVVRKGDLLISGVIAVGEDGLRYEYADGQVLALVNRQIIVEISKSGQQKVYTGVENVKKSIIFFGKEIKLFGKSSIDNPTYDTILSEKNFSLPGDVQLPVAIREETAHMYVTEPRTLSDSEAYVEAMKQYRTKLDVLLEEMEIVSVSQEHYADDQVYRITAHLVCVTDIAEASPVITS